MSDNEPVAWAIVGPDGTVLDSHIYHTEAIARRWSATFGDRVLSLYRAPTLTEDERDAVEVAITCVDELQEPAVISTLHNLLQRTK
jgi:hypothetical protein